LPGLFYFRQNFFAMPPIDLHQVPPFYHNYIRQVSHTTLTAALNAHCQQPAAYLEAIPADRWSYRYAPGKWSIKEVVQHIIDAERIFCYRALCFARGERQPLPGFDENEYAAQSFADEREKEGLMEELQTVQQSSRQLFASFTDRQLEATGIANGNPIPVKAIGFILAGHTLHHLNILNERYQ
jgi:uncharacterized damage-inducible protein DinB